MAGGRRSSIEGRVRTLWTLGAVVDVDDRTLLSRYVFDRDESAEEAFRILVERHGPMVFRVCRQVLGDRQDAEDAAQAVFLVLACKAASIRVDGSLAPWLHGVARRVASKARGRLISLRRTERDAARERGSELEPPPADDWGTLHDEVARLSEKYRTPVVLCYLQGRTYEDAARSIGCPVGTVRVRLSRAREQLRVRLTRRGFGPGRLAAIISSLPDQSAALSPSSASFLDGSAWLEATVKAVRSLRWDRTTLAEAVPSSVLSSYQGMIQTMILDGCKTAAVWTLAVGMTAAGALCFSATGRAWQEAAPSDRRPHFTTTTKAPPVLAPPEKSGEQAARERLARAARIRLDAQRYFFQEGRITIDRFIDASEQLMDCEMAASPNQDQREAAAEAHRERMGELAGTEENRLKAGAGSATDFVEAWAASKLADFSLREARRDRDSGEVDALKRRVEALEKQLKSVIKEQERAGGDPAPRPETSTRQAAPRTP
ncbi:RNA polymerase sigma factor [Paludisphaera mucosa]|uniref:Sigma-70 family RNA polymerase sigma factor n=1 Tax=Paludisphaera mucosa TaxID=3030827 RepID=A0ABT6F9S9_9BACT|nr:sigma-70 family RNA polymerase sigma factor [Paludisphaera mucosa]MDG3004319.1 sigma-70 family RNA polymerase sigma factor [Paludisphaera mucosa]